jgi:hypothetical protein
LVSTGGGGLLAMVGVFAAGVPVGSGLRQPATSNITVIKIRIDPIQFFLIMLYLIQRFLAGFFCCCCAGSPASFL